MTRALAASAAALLVAGLLGSLGPPADASRAGIPGRWSVITQGGTERPVGEIGLGRGHYDLLHVVWSRRTGGNSYDLLHTVVNALTGVVGPTQTIASGWALLGSAAVFFSGNHLRAFFPGAKTTTFGEPNFGLNQADRLADGGEWTVRLESIYRDQFAHGRTPSAVYGADGNGLQAWDGRDGVGVHLGADPAGPFRVGYGSSQCCRHDVTLARTSSETWLAWCQMNDAPNGIWAQRVDSETGSPVGSAQRMPGSVDGSGRRICEAGARVPLVARRAGGFWIAAKSGDERAVLVWRVGGSSVATPAKGTLFRRVGLNETSDGRLWVGWTTRPRATTLRFRRTNPSASKYGAVVQVAAPPGKVDTLSLSLGTTFIPEGIKRLNVFANFQAVSGTDLYHTQVLPGLTLTVKGGKILTFKVRDAGDPVPGATVRVAGRELRTGAKGAVSADLKPGRFRATASKSGYVGASLRVRSR